jgi:hypothetical protein
MKRLAILVSLSLAASLAFAADDDYKVKIKERTHGCKSPEETWRFFNLARHNNEEAARYSNEKGCLMIPAGITVALVERNPVAKINGIRLEGDKNIYYVPASDANF